MNTTTTTHIATHSSCANVAFAGKLYVVTCSCGLDLPVRSTQESTAVDFAGHLARVAAGGRY